MTYPTASTITDITNVGLGYLAQILFSKGYTSQMHRSYRDFDNILMSFKSQAAFGEREYRYLLLTALGVNAVQYQNQGDTTDVAFPSGDISTQQEVTAKMKVLRATVEIDRNVWERVKLAQYKYIDNPLAMEVLNKVDSLKRIQARAMYGDGTGVIGVVATAADGVTTTTSGGVTGTGIRIQLSTANTAVGGGNTNWFHKGEKIAFCDKDGAALAAASASGNDLAYGVVASVDRANRYVYCTTYTSANAQKDAAGKGLAVDGSFIYPVSVLDSSFVGPDRDTNCDFGTVSPVMCGLESLTRNDGGSVFGVTMSGQLGGSRWDHGGGIFDVSAIEESMNETVQNVGDGLYTWDQLIMPFNAFSALIEGKEADRRFNSVEDNARGGRKFIYQYGDQSMDCVKSYFCSFNRIFSVPKPKSGEMGESGYAIEYRGTEFKDVTVGNQKEFLKHNGTGYTNMLQSFLEGYAVMVAKQPAAVNVIHNFTMV